MKINRPLVLMLALALALACSGFAQDAGLDVQAASVSAYDLARARIDSLRQELANAYVQALDQAAQDAVIAEASNIFVQSVGVTLAKHWYGTPWDFNGVTEVPGEGVIACGYLVATLLRHAGLRVERFRLAQQASERIVLSLTTEEHVRRFRRTPLEQFIAAVRAWGQGLYVVGLDCHVGFVLHEDDEVYFIHVSYVHPRVVIREVALRSPVLASSQYRVLGKISDDVELMRKWLLQERVATRVG